ncbi:CAP domain-containing protein [Sandaracinus amylolyticus]|uniref:CAP domain-containing protein n=1 Tax=Sandaracinus amylolyticus TaxID=927083 RepID=UPI001F490786|nr:CAP domain-containing protein [Sandaracinus amylolyticus]UJR80819.1 SCP domain-containing protein [Sandaracinus amylolyticus]
MTHRRSGALLLAIATLLGCDGTLSGGDPPRVEPDVDGGPGPRTDAATAREDGGTIVDTGVAMPDGGTPDPCLTVRCGANARCEPTTGTCVCTPGFLDSGGGVCTAIPAGDPAGRTATEVCDAWAAGHVQNASDPWNEVPGDSCAPGSLTRDAIDDTLRRVNLFRWMVGLAPVTDDPAQHANDQACAVLMTRNGQLDHAPPMSWTCWSMAGANGAGSSNLALGVGSPGDAIDLYMDDSGVPSLGHRRWVLNGPLGRVGVGFAGNAQCLGVFDGSGSSTRAWTSWPSPGPIPREALRGDWSFHSNSISMRAASVRVVRVSDGAELEVSVDHPADGYGPSTVSFRPMGWSPAAGERYRVTIEGIDGGSITYEVAPVEC